MAKYGTQFMESEAILAAQSEDWNEVDKILSRMTERELDDLVGACIELGRRASRWRHVGGLPPDAL